MGCRTFGVSQVLVGLHRVGVVGLAGALAEVDRMAPSDENAAVELLLELVAADNYVAPAQRDEYRRALRRELLRHRGADFTAYLSEVPARLRMEPGPERDRVVSLLEESLAEVELRPLLVEEIPEWPDAPPELVLNGELVLRGDVGRERLRAAIRQSLSDW